MKSTFQKHCALLPMVIILMMMCPSANAQTAFTYQGRLTTGGQPAQGAHDVEFRLFDALTDGNQVGATLTENGLSVTDGVFSAVLDFGDGPFNSAPRWLQIDVREAGGGTFTTLLPRQRVGASPFAIETLFVSPGAVDTAALQDGAVTESKLAEESVTLGKLATGSVTSGAILNNQVSSVDIANGTIQRADLQDDLIGSTQIEDGTITAADVSGGVLLSDKTSYYTSQGATGTIQPSSARIVTAQCNDDNDIPIAFDCEVITNIHDVLMRDTMIANWTDNSAPASVACRFSNRNPNVGANIRASIVCLAKP